MKYKQGLEAMYGISGETCTDLIPLKGQFILLSIIFAITILSIIILLIYAGQVNMGCHMTIVA